MATFGYGGNARTRWYKEDGIQYFGVDSEPEAWIAKLEADGNEFRWTYGFIDGVALTGKIHKEDVGREIIEMFQQALDLAGEFAICK